jgi:hypothetical protein
MEGIGGSVTLGTDVIGGRVTCFGTAGIGGNAAAFGTAGTLGMGGKVAAGTAGTDGMGGKVVAAGTTAGTAGIGGTAPTAGTVVGTAGIGGRAPTAGTVATTGDASWDDGGGRGRRGCVGEVACRVGRRAAEHERHDERRRGEEVRCRGRHGCSALDVLALLASS